MDTIFIGVDFNARQQPICYLTTESGEIQLHELKHQDKKVREFTVASVATLWLGWKPAATVPGSNDCSRTGLRSLARACHRDAAAGALAAEKRPPRRGVDFGSNGPR